MDQAATPTVALYMRVSSEEQRERQSIQTQREVLLDHARRIGYRVTGEYADDGVSGTIPLKERPAGADLVADAKAGKFDTVLVYAVDRLGRDKGLTPHTLMVIAELVDGVGINLQSATEPFDTSTPSGRFMVRQYRAVCTSVWSQGVAAVAEPATGILGGDARQDLLDRAL